MTAGPEPNSTRWNTGDAAGPSLLVIAPFLAFLHLHGRSPFELDSLLIMGAVVVLGLPIGLGLKALRGSILYVVPVVVLLLIAIDLQFAADGHFRVIGAVVLIVAFVLREHIMSLASITVSVLAILTLITGPQDSVERFEALSVPNRNLPPIVHVVLDEHAGLAGFPDGSIGQAAAVDVAERYQAAGFRLFPRAFSEYSLTANSLPNALNFVTNDEHLGLLGGDGKPFPRQLKSNAYFDRMNQMGYAIHVYQPTFIDFCASAESPAASCTTVPSNSLLTLDHLGLSLPQRTGVVLRYWLAVESYLYEKVRRLGVRFGLPGQPAENDQLGPGGALELLSILEQDISTAETTAGDLYFAHLLLPHRPLVFDERCEPTRHPRAPRPGELPVMTAAYVAQVQCVSRTVTDFLNRVADALGDEAIVIVHGDHGSRLLRRPTEIAPGRLDPVAMTDQYSTFFGIRAPKAEAGTDKRLVSIRELIDQLSSSSFEIAILQAGEATVLLDYHRKPGKIAKYAMPGDWLRR